MKVKMTRRARRAEVVFRGKRAELVFEQSPITGNLYAAGKYDGEAFTLFAYRGEKRGEIGGSVVVCDALGRRDNNDFVRAVAAASKWYGFKGVGRED